MSDQQSERRRFFRIQDTIGLNIRNLDEKEQQLYAEGFLKARNSDGHDIGTYDKKIMAILDHIRIKNPEINEALMLLNRKMNAIHDLLPTVELANHYSQFPVQEVSLSACGLAAFSQEYYQPTSLICTEIVLKPDDIYIKLYATVVTCDEMAVDGEKTHHLALDFKIVHDEDQELLIQNLVQKQRRIIQKQKQNTQSD